MQNYNTFANNLIMKDFLAVGRGGLLLVVDAPFDQVYEVGHKSGEYDADQQ